MGALFRTWLIVAEPQDFIIFPVNMQKRISLDGGGLGE